MGIFLRFINFFRHCRICETDGIDGRYIEQVPELSPVKPLKFGHLYQCSRCGQFWFYQSNKHWINRIHPGHLPLVNRWNELGLFCTDAVIDSLAEIGGVPDTYHEYITIPGAVRHKTGRLYKKAAVIVSRQPPYSWPAPDKIFWASDIAAVSSSRFSLSIDIRCASAEKKEQKMGFSPVPANS